MYVFCVLICICDISPKSKGSGNMLAVLFFFFSFYSKMINAVLDSNFKESWWVRAWSSSRSLPGVHKDLWRGSQTWEGLRESDVSSASTCTLKIALLEEALLLFITHLLPLHRRKASFCLDGKCPRHFRVPEKGQFMIWVPSCPPLIKSLK